MSQCLPPATITVRLFAPDPSAADRYASLLKCEKGFRVIADDGAFRIGLFDGRLPSLHASLTCAGLQCPSMRPLLIADYRDEAGCFDWMMRGVWGVVCRDRVEADLAHACRRLAQGHPWFPPAIEVAWSLITKLNDDPLRVPLTFRECEIIHLVTVGLCNKEIGNDLRIAERTVKFHLTRIFAKLGISSRRQLALRFAAHLRQI